jgi:hypothetical protein
LAHRTFKDGDGRTWDVWEVYPSFAERRVTPPGQPISVERRTRKEPRASLPGELRHSWLAFETKTERRRLAPPPEGWEQMPDAELTAHLQRAVSTGRVRRLIE